MCSQLTGKFDASYEMAVKSKEVKGANPNT